MKPDSSPNEDTFYEREIVASARECTGLIPALPQTEAEDAHYSALYATHSAAKKRKLYRIR